MTDAFAQTLLNAIPVTIGAIATAYVTIRAANKKTETEANTTNALVTSTKAETAAKLEEVHETVNGNLNALQAKHDALAQENTMLKDQLSHAGKRSTDKRSPDRKPGKP